MPGFITSHTTTGGSVETGFKPGDISYISVTPDAHNLKKLIPPRQPDTITLSIKFSLSRRKRHDGMDGTFKDSPRARG
jgi:hypothetical protein